jgi:hypothetical protein
MIMAIGECMNHPAPEDELVKPIHVPDCAGHARDVVSPAEGFVLAECYTQPIQVLKCLTNTFLLDAEAMMT